MFGSSSWMPCAAPQGVKGLDDDDDDDDDDSVFSIQSFEKFSNTKIHKIPSSGSRIIPCG